MLCRAHVFVCCVVFVLCMITQFTLKGVIIDQVPTSRHLLRGLKSTWLGCEVGGGIGRMQPWGWHKQLGFPRLRTVL